MRGRDRWSRWLAAALLFAGAVSEARGLSGVRESGAADQATAPTLGTGVLMGVVVDSRDNAPVAASIVTLNERSLRVLADSQGRFVFSNLTKGSYTISASKLGYTDGAYGRRRPRGLTQSILLSDDQRVGDLKIPLWKDASVSGMITDEAGDPMVGVPVRALVRSYVAGRRKLTPAGALVNSDDRGFYRIGSLVPGDYAIVVPSTETSAPESVVDMYREARGNPTDQSAAFLREVSATGTNIANVLDHAGVVAPGSNGPLTPSSRSFGVLIRTADQRAFAYPTQYYPTAMSASEADSITLHTGEDHSGVNLQLKAVRVLRVSGTVTGPDGPLITGLSLAAASDDVAADAGLEIATTLSDAAGRFTFAAVPAGQYVLRAVHLPASAGRGAPPSSAPLSTGLAAMQSIVVDTSDVENVAVSMRPGFRIATDVEFEGTNPRPSANVLRQMSLLVEPADGPLPSSVTGGIGRGVLIGDNQFSSYVPLAGTYYVRVGSPPPGWALKAIVAGGQDISNVPVTLDHEARAVLTLTDHPGEVNGQVTTGSGAHDSTATILIYPAASESRIGYGSTPPTLRAIRCDQDGRYRAAGLPTGDYLIVAIADEDTDGWQDPKRLQALARVATAITLAAGETRALPLTTVKVPR